MDESLLTNKKNMKLPILPLIFFIFTIILTAWFYGYNFYLSSENNKISERNMNLERSINSLRENKEIQVYELLKQNNAEISKYERNSDIVKYMDHLSDIERKYKLSFSGFSIVDWEIKSEINIRKIDSRLESQSYEKVRDFIKNYREDKEALLELKFINSFDWMDNIKFNVNFGVKKMPEKKLEETNTEAKVENLTDNKKENE